MLRYCPAFRKDASCALFLRSFLCCLKITFAVHHLYVLPSATYQMISHVKPALRASQDEVDRNTNMSLGHGHLTKAKVINVHNPHADAQLSFLFFAS